MSKTKLTKNKKYLFFAFILNFLGIIFLSSASSIESQSKYHNSFYYLQKHLLILSLSIVVYFILSKIGSNLILRLCDPFFIISTLFLATPFIPYLGDKIYGANRWINIYGFNFQPSELAKVAILLFVAKHMDPNNPRKIFPVIIPTFLILLEPNLSNTVIIVSTVIAQYYLSDGDIFLIIKFCLASFIFFTVLILVAPYRINRFKSLIDNSYHNTQIINSLYIGGLFGRGLGNSIQKYDFLPQVSSDSLLAIVGEETGFIGISTIIFLYYLFIKSLFELTKTTHKTHTSTFTSAAALLFFFQSIINFSAIANIIPITGIPLPFFSYGGSSLLSSFIILGIIRSFSHEK